jgi:branched-chain amino acid transport system substrate-binding protein
LRPRTHELQTVTVHSGYVHSLSSCHAALLTLLLFLNLAPPATAQSRASQSIRIGVVLSSTGAAANIGTAQANALNALQLLLRSQRNLRGIHLEIILRDDASQPNRATSEVQDLLDDGAHAIVCCSTEGAARAVSPIIERARIPTISLAHTESLNDNEGFWLFGVAPDGRKLIQSMLLDLYDQGGRSLAFMALDNSYGEEAKQALNLLLGPGSLYLVAEERYRPDVSVLTPEALWVASRQPGAVLVWGLASDTATAVDALRRRGYEDTIYINPALTGPGSFLTPSTFEGVLVSTSPALFANRLPSTAPTYAETRRFQQYTARYAPGAYAVYGAYAWDAVLLLTGALEQILSYGLDLTDTQRTRYALRDSLVGMGPVTGAAAQYDHQENDRIGVNPRSLVIARMTRGTLVFER